MYYLVKENGHRFLDTYITYLLTSGMFCNLFKVPKYKIYYYIPYRCSFGKRKQTLSELQVHGSLKTRRRLLRFLAYNAKSGINIR